MKPKTDTELQEMARMDLIAMRDLYITQRNRILWSANGIFVGPAKRAEKLLLVDKYNVQIGRIGKLLYPSAYGEMVE